MREDELRMELFDLRENECVEFKEWVGQFSIWGKEDETDRRNCVYAYLVAIGNEGNGTLYIGVDDKGEIVGTHGVLADDFQQRIYEKLNVRVEVIAVETKKGRVFVLRIPRHPIGKVYRFYGAPLMRIHDGLREMDDQTLKRLLNEMSDDFTAQMVTGLHLEDLDSQAIECLQERYIKKSGNFTVKSLSSIQLLKDLELMENGKLNYAALLLLGTKKEISTRLADAEIIFEYRNTHDQIHFSERHEYRKPILIAVEEIWKDINNHNQTYQYQEGLLRHDIRTFNELVAREALLNAVTHRDYQQKGSVFVKQNPSFITFESPGGFLNGITPYNIIDQQSWRNRRLAEVLAKLGYIERSGQGVDLIFQETIKEGKGLPTYQRTDAYSVILDVSAMVTDPAFIQYLEKVTNEKGTILSARDLIVLQRIKDLDEHIPRSDVSRFLKMGIIEKIGKTKGVKYILSHRFYQLSGRTGIHTRLSGLSRDEKKALIKKHLERNPSGGTLQDFSDGLPELKKQDISNLLQELKQEGLIKVDGKTIRAVWKIKSI